MIKTDKEDHSSGVGNSQKTIQFFDSERLKIGIALAVIVLITVIAYLPVFHNEFVNWDDGVYIKNNPLILSINLKEIFSHYAVGNYQPVTILAFAIEHYFFGLNATGYHAVNLLLHLLNVLLVFYTVFLLSDKVTVALVASLLFGIHPLHVESVAWASELKNVLNTFFFLAAYIYYLKYLKELQKKFYLLALLLFLVSLLSKAMTASLPLILILTDYFKGRIINSRDAINRVSIEKVPFFLLALVFGVVAVYAQKSFSYTDLGTSLTIPQRIVFASYGFFNYLFKLLLPLKLSAFYPYPINSSGIYIPLYYYAYVILILALFTFVIYSHRFTKKIIFGMGFFTLAIFFVLQLLPVGVAIMTDHHAYIPSIGIFYLAGEGLYYLWSKKLKLPAIILLSVSAILFSVKTYARCGVWKDDMTFYNTTINENKSDEDKYYIGYFLDKSRNNEAVKDSDKADEVKPGNAEEHFNQGTVLASQYLYDEAIKEFSRAIELNPGYAEAYNKRGIVYVNEKKSGEAIQDFTRAVELKPDLAPAYNNRGIVFFNEKKNEEALKDFNKAIDLKPDYALAYNNKGNVFYEEKRYKEAIIAYNMAIEMKPDYMQAFYKRGMAEYYAGKNDEACRDLKKAADFGYSPAVEALAQFCK